MSSSARQPLAAWRNEAWTFSITVPGVDLTGKALRLQARSAPDTPGAALINLATVTNANAEGLRLASATVTNGVPTSIVQLRINKSTLQALPYEGELGDPLELAYALQIDGITRLYGPLFVLASAIDSDNAPLSRPVGYGVRSAATPTGSATLTIATDGNVTLKIDGSDLVALQVARAAGYAADAAARLHDFPNYYKGDPGGVLTDIGVAIAADGLDIPDGVMRVRSSGHSAAGVGAADYVYDPAINAANRTSYDGWAFIGARGRGFKLSPDQPLNLSMLGWKTDFVSDASRGTDNAPVIARLKSFLAAAANPRSALYRYTPEVRVPLGRAYTTVSMNFDYGTVSLIGVGQGTTDSDGLGGSVIVFAENTPGVIINSADTSGESSRSPTFGSTGSLVSGITAMSLGGAPGTAADGFRARGQFSFVNCIAIGFPRHGINGSADLQGQGGNTNASFIMNCTAVRNYLDGFYYAGGDGNACTMMHLNARYNGRCGINLSQFLANSLFGYHLEANGTNQSGPTTMPQQAGAQCLYNGRYWAVYPGRAADAQNSTPGVIAGVWVDRGPGVAHPVYPTYSSTTVWTEGSALRATGANAQTCISGGYAEPGQPPVFIGGGAMQLSGQQDAGLIGSQAYLYVSGGMLTAPAFQAYDGTGTTIIGGDPTNRRLVGMRGPVGFEWNFVYNLNGGIALRWANQKDAATFDVDANENLLVRIENPILTTIRVPNATAPVATGAVVKTLSIRDETGAELGVIEIKARA